VAESSFTAATPVPTAAAAAGGRTSLVLSNATLLSVGVVGGTTHLYIGDARANDPVDHRVLDLDQVSTSPSGSAGNTSVTMQVVRQYSSSQWLTSLKSIAVDPNGQALHMLVQSNLSPMHLVTIGSGPQVGCGA
jgi:hypothetical protein